MRRESLLIQSDIFFSEFELDKYAEERGVKMPDDEIKWTQAITDHIASNLPYLAEFPIDISFDEKEAKKGYAKGRVVVGNMISIPLIMRNFRLLPLDVMAFEENFYPLSQEMVEQILLPKDVANKPVSPEESKTIPSDLSSGNRAPYSAYANRNAGFKSASMIDKLSSVHIGDLDDLKQALREDESLACDFVSRCGKSLQKLASKACDHEAPEPSGRDKFLKIAQANNWSPDVIQLSKRASDGDMDLYMSSDKYPMAYTHSIVEPHVAARMFGAEVVKRASHGFPHSVVSGRSGHSINLPDEMSFDAQNIEKFGQYDVLSKNHKILRGFVIPEVYDFDMRKQGEMKLFTDSHQFATQEKIAGRMVAAGPSQTPGEGEIRNGVTGSFMFRFGEKTAATAPFIVTSFPILSSEKVAFDAATLDGRPMHLEVMPGIASVVAGEKRGHYYIPSLWTFINVGHHSEPIMDQVDRVKTAAADNEEKNVEIIWDGINFKFRGPQVDNLNERMDNLEPMKARFLLTAFGLPLEYAEEVLQRAKNQGYAKFHANIYPTGKYKVVSNAVENCDGSRDTKLAAAVDRIKGFGLVKEALMSPDDETVDSVLSLNFVTPRNVSEYVQNIDDFRDSMSKLAKLLVASRLGMQTVDPSAVKVAMENMAQVVGELELLRSSMPQLKAQQGNGGSKNA
jgi:hypothetical protein